MVKSPRKLTSIRVATVSSASNALFCSEASKMSFRASGVTTMVAKPLLGAAMVVFTQALAPAISAGVGRKRSLCSGTSTSNSEALASTVPVFWRRTAMGTLSPEKTGPSVMKSTLVTRTLGRPWTVKSLLICTGVSPLASYSNQIRCSPSVNPDHVAVTVVNDSPRMSTVLNFNRLDVLMSSL